MSTIFTLVLPGCRREEEATPEVEVQPDWRKEKAQPRELRNQGDADEPEVKAVKKKTKPVSVAPKKPRTIISPIDQFEIVNVPSHAVSLMKEEGQLANRDSFVVLSKPAEDVDAKFHRIQPPKATPGPDKDQSLKLPSGFVEIDESGYSQTGWPLRIRCLADNAEMAFEPGGVATIGTNDGPIEAQPPIKVSIDPFYIDVTEVTVEQYDRFREYRQNEGVRIKEAPNGADDPQRPVLGLSYNQARVYCLWAGKLLPNEAQWEYAARGNSGSRYPWRQGNPIWQHLQKGSRIHIVATDRFDRTPEGVFDLAGNALEWCNDWYYPDTYKLAAEKLGQPIKDFAGPGRPGDGNQRVVKGRIEKVRSDWSAWNRQGISQTDSNERIGFRGVLSLSPTDQ
ncbi:formylglycine-generating enzyme family protein [Polystyrenella longa]|uniref:formylglycine-generating enzyme family protein n=1 Tax=Polystyrenella longa TaxID=2528007 RepID=UPI0011A981AF|nr:SUMF1/EgtB/PvdO family nonheme iron enzyme [Polystyrenella longa]